ncbi:hypothetical protein LLG46_07265 [bacterium]|nr:hypothetical protein [bacterium]
MNIFAKLQNIDRRILYLLVALVIIIPLVRKPARHPRTIFKEVQSAYDTIQAVPNDKLVILSSYFDAGTVAENGPQVEAMMRHLFRKGTKFATVTWDPVGAELVSKIGKQVSGQMHKQYGRDWVDLGYNPGPMYVIVSGMAKDFQKVIKQDKYGTKLADISATKDVKSAKQIGTVIEVTASGTVPVWIAYFNMPNNIPLVYCPTAVMAAEAYPYLDSGQLNGMLNGVIGSAQYETLLGMGNEATYSSAASWALSTAHIFIIVLLIIGNIGYFAANRARGGRRHG